ncbi:MAG TPA: hypothetical protein HPP76_02290 [Desulfuromonadales bacterium]|nr:hypothetical protein [Desulfuromonadales bacterium]
MKTTIRIIVASALLVTLNVTAALAASMSTYCITPPFISQSTTPNLLLLIDNSASMYDLAYDDPGVRFSDGLKHCSGATGTTCTTDAGCTGVGKCTAFSTQPKYCYDASYTSSKTYVGYFDPALFYTYDLTNTNGVFNSGSTLTCPSVSGNVQQKLISGQLCVNYDNSRASGNKVTSFSATGNYLNWLTASKFDVEKEALTGGKYVTKLCSNDKTRACLVASDCLGSGTTCDTFNVGTTATPFLMPETRGCNGQDYIKDTSVGITFTTTGPQNKYNTVAPSWGGQTYLNIYAGSATFDYTSCQNAISALAASPLVTATVNSYFNSCVAMTAKPGTCSLDSSTACAIDSDCKLNTVTASTNVCDGAPYSNVITTCATAGNTCGNLASNRYCTLVAGRSCTSDANCTSIVIKNGTCSPLNMMYIKEGVNAQTVTSAGNSCSADTTCTFDGYIAQTGACSGIVTLNGGTCAAAASTPSAGTCRANSKGTCVGGLTTGAIESRTTFSQALGGCLLWVQGGSPSYSGSGSLSGIFSSMSPWKDTICPALYTKTGKVCVNITSGTYTTTACTTANSTTDSACTALGTDYTCLEGPAAIDPNSPGGICSNSYIGKCMTGSGSSWAIASNCQDWIGYPNGLDKLEASYCTGVVTVNLPVTDPTNPPADSTLGTNLGSILGGMGVSGQMGPPLKTLPVRISAPTAPTGIVQDYSSKIRIGVMKFNNFGSSTETAFTGSTITARKVCSTDSRITCNTDADCGGTSGSCAAGTDTDGGNILSYVGDTLGDHTTASSIIYNIDSLRAVAWTPLAEAMYNAIGYFAGKSTPTMRLNTADYDATKPPSTATCQANNVLMVTDGSSTADQNATVDTLVTGNATAAGAPASASRKCSVYYGSSNFEYLTWLAKNKKISTLSSTVAETPVNKSDFITTYVVSTGADNGESGECNNTTMLTHAATNGGTSMLSAIDPSTYKATLNAAFQQVAAGLASGTAASILNNSEGSGANLLQAVFYPEKDFGGTNNKAQWIGEMQNFWYYVDPFFNRSTVRADTNSDFSLDLNQDYIAKFRYDTATTTTYVDLAKDINGDGSVLGATTSYLSDSDNVKSLWRAGRKLWERDVTSTAGKRLIYTVTAASPLAPASNYTPPTPSLLVNNGTFNAVAANITLLQAATSTEAGNIIDFVQGIDQTQTTPSNLSRSRKVTISNCGIGNNGTDCKREWKLGDIINSTPRLISTVKINSYSLDPPTGYGDTTYTSFISSYNYKHRGMAFVGGNDGMLHAFRLGVLDEGSQTKQHKGKLLNIDGSDADSTSDLGREEWAFIPRNALPYLKYSADPTYAHLYFVDNSVAIFDASLHATTTGCTGNYYDCIKKTTVDSSKNLTMDETSWRTILIGGMGIGGATRSQNTATKASGGCDADTSTGTCVKTPIATSGYTEVGYSSYFALDVTNPHVLFDATGASATKATKFLWEFAGDPANGDYLGYTTSGPAIVRIGTKEKNGRWFALFASGPTGPIDTTTHSFIGKSDQNLKVFVVDVATGALVRTIDTGVKNAFAGNLTNAVIDNDRWNRTSTGFYSDDVIYIGYTQTADDPPTTSSLWNKGGVVRIFTKEDTNPANWVSTSLISNIGPVTTSITKLQDRFATYDSSKSNAATGKLWLYFGTGRYFQKSDSLTDQFKLYGVMDPCYSNNSGTPNFTPVGANNEFDTACTKTVTVASLTDQSGDSSTAAAISLPLTSSGWSIDLDLSATGFSSERVITNPVASTAGAVLFTTFKPTSDVCGSGGNSNIWAVNYKTGAAPPGSAMQGKVLMQVSTGALAEVALSTAFTSTTGNKREDGRRTATPITGMPPTANGLALITNPKPIKKILHYQEK